MSRKLVKSLPSLSYSSKYPTIDEFNIISYRGNTHGHLQVNDNAEFYIDIALALDYKVLIDIWCIAGEFMLGYEEPKYSISDPWVNVNSDKLWFNARNGEALERLLNMNCEVFYMKEGALYAISNKGTVVSYSRKYIVYGSYLMLPEKYSKFRTKIPRDIKNKIRGIITTNVINYIKK